MANNIPGSQITIVDALKILTEDPSISGKLAYTTVQALLDYFNAKGYKTISEIQTFLADNNYLSSSEILTLLSDNNFADLDSLGTDQIFTKSGATAASDVQTKIPDQVFAGFSLSFVSGPKISIGAGVYGNNIFAGLSKIIASPFSTGNNGNGLNTSLTGLLGVYLIKDVSDNLDVYFDDLAQTNTPSGWSVLKQLGSFWHTATLDTDIVKLSLKEQTIPIDYISNFSLSYTANGTGDNDITLTPDNDVFLCKANTATEKNKTDISLYEPLTGKNLGGAADTIYYVYITTDSNGENHAIQALTDATGTGFDNFRLIGFYKTDASGDVFMAWTIKEKWDDENFSIGSLAKETASLTDAPNYSALFSADGNTIKIGSFPTGEDRQVDLVREYRHGAKDNFPIQLHFHGYPEDATSGNAVFFVDILVTNLGDTNTVTAPTRLTKTVSMPGVKGEHFNESFGWYISTAELKEGAQVWITFGRLGTDAADTYAASIAIGTFGYHYCIEKAGTDLILTEK